MRRSDLPHLLQLTASFALSPPKGSSSICHAGERKLRTVLKPSEKVLKHMCKCSTERGPVAFLAKNEPDFTEPLATDSRSKSFAESFIINTWLVSCAASGSHFACASPGSVAAYHGALSRLRLGFKSRLGRSFFDFF